MKVKMIAVTILILIAVLVGCDESDNGLTYDELIARVFHNGMVTGHSQAYAEKEAERLFRYSYPFLVWVVEESYRRTIDSLMIIGWPDINKDTTHYWHIKNSVEVRYELINGLYRPFTINKWR